MIINHKAEALKMLDPIWTDDATPVAMQSLIHGMFAPNRAFGGRIPDVCQHIAPFALVGYERCWIRT
jgi:hypothetical protein